MTPEAAKDLALARIFFAGSHPERDLLPELRRLRSARRARLARLKVNADHSMGADPAGLRTLTRAHARAVEAAGIRWLDQVIARLESLDKKQGRQGGRPRRP